MKMKNFFIVFCLFFILSGVGCSKKEKNNKLEKIEDKVLTASNYKKEVIQTGGDSSIKEKMSSVSPIEDKENKQVKGMDIGIMMSESGYNYSGILSDVTDGNASGLARAGYFNGEYNLYVSFADLATPGQNEFYEGWLVKKDPFSYVSVGKVEKIGGIYNNLYKTSKNLSKYDYYVLTLEKDTDPKPGVHVLEGTIIKNK